MSEKIGQILTGLNNKANLKQQVYHNTLEVFEQFKHGDGSEPSFGLLLKY